MLANTLRRTRKRDPIVLYNNGLEPVTWVTGYTSGSGSQYKQADHLYINQLNTGQKAWATEVLIDLTNISKLYIDWDATRVSGTETDSFFAYLIVSTDRMDDYSVYTVRMYIDKTQQGRRIDSLNVSGLSGSYYVKVVFRHAGTQSCNEYLKTYKVWGE